MTVGRPVYNTTRYFGGRSRVPGRVSCAVWDRVSHALDVRMHNRVWVVPGYRIWLKVIFR